MTPKPTAEYAEHYDELMQFLATTFGADEAACRRRVLDQLRLRPGMRVLDIATGTGANIPLLLDAVGDGGEVWALDFSPEMLAVARARYGHDARVRFIEADASELPCEDRFFDATLSTGGVNQFPWISQSLREMDRVTKVGARICIADEGIAPWLSSTPYAHDAVRIARDFSALPPIFDLPTTARDVVLWWDFGLAFYAIAWTVAATPPEVTR